MISKLMQYPLLKRLISSLSIRILKILKKNRGFFKIKDIQMYLDFLDPIDRQLILNQKFEEEEINFLIDQIKRDQVNHFLDVGANCGYYSIYIANIISKINILSFEPNKEAYFKFFKTLEKNPILSKSIDLKKFGLSNKNLRLLMQSKIKFGYSQTGGSSIINKNKAENTITFFGDFKIGDENIKLTNEKIAIKIDVEGHEINVLKGLKKIIQKNECIILVEIFNENFELINNFLLSHGYSQFYNIKERSNYFYKNYD